MRSFILGFAAALMALSFGSAAEAGHRGKHHRHYAGKVKVVHYAHHRRHRAAYSYGYGNGYGYGYNYGYGRGYRVYATDPYAYYYSPRGYYPYYNSAYWRPTAELRFRRDCCRPVPYLPPYYQAWGHPQPYYRHREWHYSNYGYIRHGHW